TEHFAAVKYETRRSAGAQLRCHLCVDRTWLRPRRHLFAEPLDRQLLPPHFGGVADFLREFRRGSRDGEVRRPIAACRLCGGRNGGVADGDDGNRKSHRADGSRAASFHALLLLGRQSLSKAAAAASTANRWRCAKLCKSLAANFEPI